ncbi:MAG: hypothetical protein V1663_01680 [archaeon]
MKLIYIHTLKDLSPKSAEIESTYLVRDLKQRGKLPLKEDDIVEEFSSFFVSKTDIDAMIKALDTVPLTVQEIIDVSQEKGDKGNFELINLQRACSALQEIPNPLRKNINYAKNLFEWQNLFITQVTPLLNIIPNLKTQNEKLMYQDKISNIFERILRNKENFMFNFEDVIHEGQLTRMRDLSESMKNGFLFHVKIDEHLKKENFGNIKKRIPDDELERTNIINKKINDIKEGVERAYDANMRMVNMAILLYSYVRWLRK